jgi:dUTP pyrophosphatase
MQVALSLLHPEARVPAYAHGGDAGCDLVAVESVTVKAQGVVLSWERAWRSRSRRIRRLRSAAKRFGVAPRRHVREHPGLIDSGYRGEIKVALVNLDPESDYEVHAGDRVQLVIMAIPAVSFEAVTELPSAQRATGGFGSTGR